MKYGAKDVIITYRNQPMGFKWPKGIEERPLVQRFDETTAYFKDGTKAEVRMEGMKHTTVETAYKVAICPIGNILYMGIYLMTDLKVLWKGIFGL